MAKESEFQSRLREDLETIFPGCITLKLDPSDFQGIPDLLILYKNHWAALECKKSKSASHRPNQEYYVNVLNEMSYAAFIYPENREDILDELQRSFEV